MDFRHLKISLQSHMVVGFAFNLDILHDGIKAWKIMNHPFVMTVTTPVN